MPCSAYHVPYPIRVTEEETVFTSDDWDAFEERQRTHDQRLQAHFLNMEEGILDLWEEMWEARREALSVDGFLESHRASRRSMGQM
jgi:hypothetical protein